MQIVGRGCLIQAQACRYKKDLKTEPTAKEISDALPFLEYDLQRLLVNKLKAKGMNAIFGVRITMSIGERMIALIGTGTGVYLPALPPPAIPKIVQGNSWTNAEKINELNRSLEECVNRNREIYQLKVYGVSADGPSSATIYSKVRTISIIFEKLSIWSGRGQRRKPAKIGRIR